MAIPFFDYPALFARHETEIADTILAVMRSGKYILQEELVDFETELAEYLGIRAAIGVGSGTEGIFIGLKAADLGSGDEIILPSHTFIATASAVTAAGATPVLVDVRDDHLMDPQSVEAAITDRTRAIIPVHLNGRTCEMDTIGEIAGKHSLCIIEDAAQALGSSFKGRFAGTFGMTGSFSFYPAKLLGCFGDGGAVVTDDQAVAERIFSLRDHGRMDDGGVREWSYNTRLDNIQAALLSLKLRYFDDDLRRRREIAAAYDSRLGRYEELLLPPPPVESGDHHDVFQNYEVECTRRDDLREHLAGLAVGTIIQWGGTAVHQFPALGFDVQLPVTERIMRDSLLLPMHPALSDEDVDGVCDAIDSFFVA
jgi:dTDP-4-amino-4,6-dideoxygalactose transaminase